MNLRRTSKLLSLGAVAAWVLASGCSSHLQGQGTQGALPVPVPTLNLRQVAEGRKIYQQFCANCHGPNAEGAPNWKIPDAQGHLPAPPHDNTGHTWHHADQLLIQLIRNGVSDPLQPNAPKRMDGFGEQLSETEIHAVLEYFKSLWTPDRREFQWRVTNNDFQPTLTPSR